MKIDVKEATVTSNVPQENVTSMSISVDGMEHIMTLLTNLYKDPELAVIREYYTNALDAHVAAGVTKPVSVSLPSWANPIYIVQDYGIGMSKSDIQNIYAQYGASTKRNTNDQVGAFGLGCKSALTIATQFTLVSIKNGMKTTALIAKSESGVNTVNVISNVETHEPNGTTVKIPVASRVYDFEQKARKFFQYSAPGSVLVDGKEPTSILASAERVADPDDDTRIAYLRPRGDGESQVIMGSVPYALSNTEIDLSLQRLGLDAGRGFIRMPKYFPVPIGSVDLTPSREGLRFTDKTNEVIDSRMKFILTDLQQIAYDEMDTCKTIDEFYESFKRWEYIADVKRVWKGEEVPIEVFLKNGYRGIKRTTYSTASHTDANWIRLDKSEERIVVKGYAAEDYKKINNYLTPYMNSQDLDSATFIVTDDPDFFTNKWVLLSERFTYVDGSDIIAKGKEQRKKDRAAAAKAGKKATAAEKIKYPVLFVDENIIRWTPYDLISKGTPYMQSSEISGDFNYDIKGTYKSYSDRAVGATVTQYLKTITDAKEIILLNNTRTVKALETRVKGTRSLSVDMGKAIKRTENLITEDMARHHSITQTSWKRFLLNSGLDKKLDKIKDESIVEVITPSKKVIDDYNAFNLALKALSYFRYNAHWQLPNIETVVVNNVTDPLDRKYPLVGAINTWHLEPDSVDHLVKYFNMVHEESTP